MKMHHYRMKKKVDIVMKYMKKMLFCVTMLVCLLVMTGCYVKTSMSYNFHIDNGDDIRVTLDTGDKFKMTSDVPFVISQNGEALTQGAFIHGDAYAQYKNAAQTDEKSKVLDSGTKDGDEYVFWNYDGREYNYVILVKDSNTGIVLGNTISEESAKECFNRLTIQSAK